VDPRGNYLRHLVAPLDLLGFLSWLLEVPLLARHGRHPRASQMGLHASLVHLGLALHRGPLRV